MPPNRSGAPQTRNKNIWALPSGATSANRPAPRCMAKPRKHTRGPNNCNRLSLWFRAACVLALAAATFYPFYPPWHVLALLVLSCRSSSTQGGVVGRASAVERGAGATHPRRGSSVYSRETAAPPCFKPPSACCCCCYCVLLYGGAPLSVLPQLIRRLTGAMERREREGHHAEELGITAVVSICCFR